MEANFHVLEGEAKGYVEVAKIIIANHNPLILVMILLVMHLISKVKMPKMIFQLEILAPVCLGPHRDLLRRSIIPMNFQRRLLGVVDQHRRHSQSFKFGAKNIKSNEGKPMV
jgi:flagellar biogenesis protein FliO